MHAVVDRKYYFVFIAKTLGQYKNLIRNAAVDANVLARDPS